MVGFVNKHSPRILIGMPVYNGAQYIPEAIESILNQTFSDFQLLISDNASTDQTREICGEYVERDNRVLYYRQKDNLGMVGNFNYVAQCDVAEYFKWAAHDDILKPDYLQRCIDLLDANPFLSMAHCPTSRVDDQGKWLGIYEDLGLSSHRASERFWRVLWTINIYEMYGVMRSDLVKKTKPIDNFFGSERNRLAEVLLQGDIGYLQESLFSRRDHSSSMTEMHLASKKHGSFSTMQEAHDPKAKMSSLQASSRKFSTYLDSIFRFPMPLTERIACLRHLIEWGYIRMFEGGVLNDKYREKLYEAQKNLVRVS